MHFYITGGSGRNGSLTIAAALAASGKHTVTALVRNPSSASLQPYAANPNLTLITGSPLSQSAVVEALTTPRRPDAVISTLSLARKGTSPFAGLHPDTTPDFMSQATRILLDAINTVYSDSDSQKGTRPKIIINSTLGAGDSWSSMSWVFRLLFSYSPMRHGVADHDTVDALVRDSGLRFVLARAGRLTEQQRDDADKEPKGQTTAAVRVLPDNGKGLGVADAITRQSLAKWLVLAAEQDTWDGRSPVLIN